MNIVLDEKCFSLLILNSIKQREISLSEIPPTCFWLIFLAFSSCHSRYIEKSSARTFGFRVPTAHYGDTHKPKQEIGNFRCLLQTIRGKLYMCPIKHSRTQELHQISPAVHSNTLANQSTSNGNHSPEAAEEVEGFRTRMSVRLLSASDSD